MIRLIVALLLLVSPAFAQQPPGPQTLEARIQAQLGAQAFTIAALQTQLEQAQAQIQALTAENAKLKNAATPIPPK